MGMGAGMKSGRKQSHAGSNLGFHHRTFRRPDLQFVVSGYRFTMNFSPDEARVGSHSPRSRPLLFNGFMIATIALVIWIVDFQSLSIHEKLGTVNVIATTFR